jgi:hypothetical protein
MRNARRILASLVIAGCTGTVGEPGARDELPVAPWMPSASDFGHPDARDGVRRLTPSEIRASIAAMFGGGLAYRDTLAPEARTLGYERVADGLTVSPAHVEGFFSTAGSVANAAIASEGALAPYFEGCTLPPRDRARVVSQIGASLVCTYLANCYYDDTDVSLPNHKPDGSEPGLLHYDETAPSAGRYRIAIEAHLGGLLPDPPSTLAIVHGSLGEVGRFVVDGSSFRTYTVELDVAEPGIQPMRIEWASPRVSPERRVHIRSISLEGPLATESGTSAADRACAESFAARLGARAFRRPLTSAEQALFMEAFDRGAESHFWDGIRMVIEVALASPQFLYLVEVGRPTAAPGIYALDDYELASRLSFLAWGEPPDDELRALAAAGRLSAPDSLATQAERLFADERARSLVRRFYREWLELDAVETLVRPPADFPEFTPALRASMLEETHRFLDDAIWQSGATLADVLGARHSFLDENLAALYGTSASGFERTDLPPERRGLLTQASLLAARSQSNQTSPVQRGVFVLERILCAELPSPPPSLMITPPAVTEEPRTTRDRWAAHSADASCRTCHAAIDPVGFAFEGFDPIGRYRTEERGMPVDTRGGVPLLEIEDGSIAGAAELADTIAARPEARACLARQWLRFGLGRLERDVDRESVDAIAAVESESGLRAMLVALARTDTFRHRIVMEER